MPNKILFLTSWFPSKKHPSLGNFVSRHAECAGMHHDVDVLYVTGMDDVKEIHIEEEQEGNHRILRCYYPRHTGRGPFSNLVKAGLYMRAWRKLISLYFQNNPKPDLIHLHVMFPAGRLARELKLRYNIPFVVSEHWTGYLSADGRFQSMSPIAKRMIRNTARLSDRMLPVSEDLEKALIDLDLGKRFERLPNVVDTDKFVPGNSSDSNCLRILHVSNLHPEQKNIEGMLRALAGVKHQLDFELTLVGEEGKDSAVEQAKRFGLEDRCQFRERLNQEEVIQCMQDHDLFLLFSNFENLPCVLIEAAACGLPIISTEVGGISEYFNRENRNAILIPSGDERALQEALLKKDSYDWMSATELHDWSVRHFGMEAVGGQMQKIYSEIIEGKEVAS